MAGGTATGNAIQSAAPATTLSNPVTVAQGGTGQITANAGFNALSPLTTAGDLIIENGTPVAARLAVGTTSQMLGVSGGLPAWVSAFNLQAVTALAGYSLVNGTGNIITWTAPNDGALHQIMVGGNKHVTSTETGGNISLAFTQPDGTSVAAFTILAGASGAGLVKLSNAGNGLFFVEANTTVTISQSSALTGGVSVAWVSIWGT